MTEEDNLNMELARDISSRAGMPLDEYVAMIKATKKFLTEDIKEMGFAIDPVDIARGIDRLELTRMQSIMMTIAVSRTLGKYDPLAKLIEAMRDES